MLASNSTPLRTRTLNTNTNANTNIPHPPQDGSGDVDIDEFVTGMKGMGLKLRDSQFHALHADCDTDGDGCLTLKEFTNAAKVAKRRMDERKAALKAQGNSKSVDGDSVAALKARVAGGGGGGGGGGAAKGPMGGAGSADNLKQVRWEVVLKFFKSQKGMGSKVVQMFKDLDAVSFR